MPQPPYSPDMAPCDFFLFPKIKRPLKGRRFTAIDDIKTASLKELKAIPKFEKCFEDWEKRWHKCIISNGDYFEDNNINVDEWINIFFSKNENSRYFLNTPRKWKKGCKVEPCILLSHYFSSSTMFPLWGSMLIKFGSRAHTHTYARTHTHTRARARMHARTHQAFFLNHFSGRFTS